MTPSRRRLALPEPPGSAPLPRAEDLRGPWYRAHHPGYGAWYFASSGPDDADGGRFDLAEPYGTCYLASDPQAALRERLGIIGVGRPLTVAAVAACAISLMTLTARHRRDVADTTHPDAADSLTREIATTTDYGRTRRWARHWHDEEHRSGVRYEPRFSTGSAVSLALFGPSGPATYRSRRIPLVEIGVAVISRRAAEVIE